MVVEEFDKYKSIGTPAEGIYKESGSRFLAFAYPVETEEEAKTLLQEKRKEYYDARHHCLAFRIGYKGDVCRASDDGEPSGRFTVVRGAAHIPFIADAEGEAVMAGIVVLLALFLQEGLCLLLSLYRIRESQKARTAFLIYAFGRGADAFVLVKLFHNHECNVFWANYCNGNGKKQYI